MTRMISMVSLALSSLAVATLPVAPASARDPVVVTANSEIPVRRVSFADLNLAHAQGIKVLESRVRGAAVEVCADSGWTNGNREESQGFRKCRTDKFNEARPAIALAAQRARDIALTGTSLVAATSTIGIAGK